MILSAIIVLFLIFCIILSALFAAVLKKYNAVKSDANKMLLAIKRVRYGDINVRVENMKNNDLENAANRLFETMYDREMMIKEYQSTLAKKNLSLEEVLRQEKQLNLFKEEFAATLTHDMKVPVIAELNSLNYLLEGRFGNLNEKQTEIIKLMKSSNQELKDLIENMLETYRLEQKSINLNKTKNNLNSFLESTAFEMQPIFLQNNHKLVIDLHIDKKFECYFDEFQLKRVIKNLLQNAVSFSSETSDIKLFAEICNNQVKISITNKGQSISQEDLNLIFQKYYTGHSKFRKAGTGLGLYLSQQILSAHNGTIEADTSKQGYTTFILILPL